MYAYIEFLAVCCRFQNTPLNRNVIAMLNPQYRSFSTSHSEFLKSNLPDYALEMNKLGKTGGGFSGCAEYLWLVSIFLRREEGK